MQADDLKMFLENIEEYVMDEGKIVTYKWISATLDLHVNTAKQLLYQYAMPNNKKKDGVHMTYLVAGTLANGSGMRFQIVRENDLDNVKSQFKLITSEHVYSVQKASHLPDLNILYGVDNLKNEKNYDDRFGAIRCSKAVRRPESDIKSLKIKARAATAVVPNVVPSSKKASGVSCSDKKSEPVGLELPVPISSSKTKESEPTNKSVESKSSNSPSIASLFTAQAKASKPNDKATSVASNNKPAAKKGKGGGIAMFFTKQSEKPTIKNEPKETLKDLKPVVKEDNEPIDKQSVAVSTDSKSSAPTEEKLNVEKDAVKEKSCLKSDMKEKKRKSSKDVETNSRPTPKPTSSSKRGKKKKSSENSQPAKKRKRIMVISDDSASDEDIFGSDSDTEIRPPSPEILPEAPPVKSNSSDEDMIPATPISQQMRNGKMRKRKLVEKTFEDKDGFMITKKEFVFESCSEDDGDNDKQASTGSNETPVPVGVVVEEDKPNIEIKDNVQDVEKDKPSKKQAKGEKQTKGEKQAKGEKPTKKKKASPPVTGSKSKQSTLMSFFNKN